MHQSFQHFTVFFSKLLEVEGWVGSGSAQFFVRDFRFTIHHPVTHLVYATKRKKDSLLVPTPNISFLECNTFYLMTSLVLLIKLSPVDGADFSAAVHPSLDEAWVELQLAKQDRILAKSISRLLATASYGNFRAAPPAAETFRLSGISNCTRNTVKGIEYLGSQCMQHSIE